MSTAQHTTKIEPYPVARFVKHLPAEHRGRLPRMLSERVGRDHERRDTIETAVVTIDPFEPPPGASRERDWLTKLPELDEHYADGWCFGYANYGRTHTTLHVYVWKPIPGAGQGLRA